MTEPKPKTVRNQLVAAVAGMGAIVVVLVGGVLLRAQRGPQEHATRAKAAAAGSPNWPCSLGVPTVSSTIPNDSPLTDQPTMNCTAWQEFIALNWAAAPGKRGAPDPSVTPAQFGAPNATAPTVWETYKASSEVMLPGGATPKKWDDPPPPPPCSGNPSARALLDNPRTRVLSMVSAFGEFSLDETTQASGQWLADQNGNIVYYEIKLNQDEFNTIVDNHFYNATVQETTASTGKNPAGGAYQVKLPSGCLPGTCPNNGSPVLGAIEIKAAWRILTDPSRYSHYLTAQAVLVNNGKCSTATMGLVGLHIIHKTITQPQFIWATFEQVDNLQLASPATFSNPSCKCQILIPNSCSGSKTPLYENCLSTQKAGDNCTANTTPGYDAVSTGCAAYPIQVSRNLPIPNNSSDPVVATNTAAQQLITGANTGSVFQYYQLIDVLWSGSPQNNYTNQPGTPGPQVPLSMSGATPDPSALPVANATMETYVQRLTCLKCHVFAHTPPPKTGTYATDFSFILGAAQSPVLAAAHEHERRNLPKGLVVLKH